MVCSYPGCNRPVAWTGLCNGHYLRKQRGTDMDKPFKDSKSGLRSHPLYGIWDAMKQRCNNPNHSSYANYGGRGISICERWLTFKGFLGDLEDTWEVGLTLERIDNTRGYCPENCKWATRTEQLRNTRRNVVTQDLADHIRTSHTEGVSRQTLAADLNINQHTVDSVLYKDRWK